jgi:hypothetical protein
VSVLADVPDYSPHVATAAQVAATGVPLLTKSGLIVNFPVTGLAHGASAGPGTVAVSQPGYEVIVNPQFPAGATSPFVEITLQWTDSSTGAGTAIDSFIVPGCTNASGLFVTGRGPTKGDRLTISITNLDTTNSVNCTLEVLQNSRIYPADVWRFNNKIANIVTIPNFTTPSFPDDQSCLGTVTGMVLNPSQTGSVIMGIGTGGPVTLTIEASGPVPTNARFHAYALPTSVYGATPPLIAYQAANLNQQYTFNPPRAPWLFQAVNTGTAGTLTVNFTAFAST